MKYLMGVLLTLGVGLQSIAQNVGIGLNNPSDNLHIHSGAATSSGVSFTNQAIGASASNGMRLGILYDGANANNRYGFINLPSELPFNIWQGAQRRFIIGSTGNVGVGMAPYNFATLNVNGSGYFFAKGTDGTLVSASDTSTTPTWLGSGFSASKRLTTGLNFINLLMRGDKPQAYLEANFKNGTANQRTGMIKFDSTGLIGMGKSILDSSVHSQLHLFGSQTIQGGDLAFYGPDKNYDRADNQITFSYNQYGDENPESLLEPSYNYFIRHNNRRTTGGPFFSADPEYKRGTFAIGRYQSNPFPASFYVEGDRIAIAMSPTNKVGIGRYPSPTDAINQIFISGNTHFSASRITLDRPSGDDINTASLEFRNGGAYRGAIGWDHSAGRFFFFDGESNTNTIFINNGRVGILRDPTTNALEVAGNASKSSAGDWMANSDARLKKLITPLENPLEKLLQLQGVTYQWNDNQTGTERPTGTHMGFTAQNVQQVFPQLVNTDAQGFLQTAYGTYDALYVEAIKALLKKVEALEAKVQRLEIKNQ